MSDEVELSLDVREMLYRLRAVEGERYRRLALDAAMMIEYLAKRQTRPSPPDKP